MGYASLRVLNQEVLAPGASFQPRTYPSVDILNLILQGEAEYRDSDGNAARAKAGEALLLATQPGLSYSEQNVSSDTPLTRLQLWLDACPERSNERVQRLTRRRRATCCWPHRTARRAACSCASRSGSTISICSRAKSKR